MEDDLTNASLQVLEDLSRNSSFGQAGLHSVGERPSIRRSTGSSTKESHRATVTLRRSSLMNERTRSSRRSYRPTNERATTVRGRHPMRKRKSDELSSIDLSELDSSSFYKSHSVETLSPLTPPKNTLDNIGDVFSGMNARWQQAFQSDSGRPPRPEAEADKSFHPLSGSGIFTKAKDPPGIKDGATITPSTPA
ncbi:MAG: hypothetical protein SGARI_006864, partial [Bacillariaceae sp.]